MSRQESYLDGGSESRKDDRKSRSSSDSRGGDEDEDEDYGEDVTRNNEREGTVPNNGEGALYLVTLDC